MSKYIKLEDIMTLFYERPYNWTDSEAEIQEQIDYDYYKSQIESLPTIEVKGGDLDEAVLLTKDAYSDLCLRASQVSEDCIERDLIINQLLNLMSVEKEHYEGMDKALKLIEHAPSVVPSRAEGEWIEREDWNGDNYYDCSICSESFVFIDGTPSMNLYHYCPNCGAKMKVRVE